MLLNTVNKGVVALVSAPQTQQTQQARPEDDKPRETQPAAAPTSGDTGVVFDISPEAIARLEASAPAAIAAPAVTPALIAPITMAGAAATAPGRAAPAFAGQAGAVEPAASRAVPEGVRDATAPAAEAEESQARAFAESQLLRDRLLELATRAYQETQKMQRVQDLAAPTTTPGEAGRNLQPLRQSLTAS